MFKLQSLYRKPREPTAAPLKGTTQPKALARKKARRAKHALSGFQETDLYQNTDLTSTLGSVTPCRRGQD